MCMAGTLYIIDEVIMRASVVRIEQVIDHPNADSLTIYEVSNDININSVQVVANQENVYNVGDNVVYIHIGSVIKDGTKIKARKLRDVVSYGMLCGPTTLPVGTDVSEEWCLPEEQAIEVKRTSLKHQKWPSIESLAHVRRTAKAHSKLGMAARFNGIKYGAKLKLHGTNAAVQIAPDGEVVAQKRSSVIYPDQDNQGFATWVYNNKAWFERMANEEKIVTVHGEWYGPGIQKGVACSSIPEKSFAIFALQIGSLQDANAFYVVEPDDIRINIGHVEDAPWKIIPWHSFLDIDFLDDYQMEKTAARITNAVFDIEDCDPFIKENYNIEGTGEGLVYYPILEGVDYDDVLATEYAEYLFKSVGKKHRSNAHTSTKEPIDIEKLDNINQFVDKFVTLARLQQAVVEGCNDEYETKLIGQFLKWVANDIKKESVVELEEAGFTWKEASKSVSTKARVWYQQQIEINS